MTELNVIQDLVGQLMGLVVGALALAAVLMIGFVLVTAAAARRASPKPRISRW